MSLPPPPEYISAKAAARATAVAPPTCPPQQTQPHLVPSMMYPGASETQELTQRPMESSQPPQLNTEYLLPRDEELYNWEESF